jgi:hypothetical protein
MAKIPHSGGLRAQAAVRYSQAGPSDTSGPLGRLRLVFALLFTPSPPRAPRADPRKHETRSVERVSLHSGGRIDTQICDRAGARPRAERTSNRLQDRGTVAAWVGARMAAEPRSRGCDWRGGGVGSGRRDAPVPYSGHSWPLGRPGLLRAGMTGPEYPYSAARSTERPDEPEQDRRTDGGRAGLYTSRD